MRNNKTSYKSISLIILALFSTQIGFGQESNSIIGVWNRGYQPKIETLTRINDSLINKPFRIIESITFNKDATFLHKRSPPCGNDIFFNKQGTYTISKNELILKYKGGEEFSNFYDGSKNKDLTKKETIIYVYNWVDSNTITIEVRDFDENAAIKEEELKENSLAKGLKTAEKNGFIKGIVGDDFIWFPSYEITDAWFAQIDEHIKKEPENKKYNIAKVNKVEYLSNYIFNEALSITNKPTTYFASHISLIKGKRLKGQINFRIQNKLNNKFKSYETCDKTKFKNIKIKDGFLRGKIKGLLVESFSKNAFIPVNIKVKIKLRRYN